MYKCRVKEVAINKDGTDVWYYPEIEVTVKPRRKFWSNWFADIKPIKVWKQIKRVYNLRPGEYTGNKPTYEWVTKKDMYSDIIDNSFSIVAFRTLLEATKFAKELEEEENAKLKNYQTNYYKVLGATVEQEAKIHEL